MSNGEVRGDLLFDARPCPFCASGHTYLETNDRDHPSWWLSCARCHAEGPKCGSTEAALNRWNERYDDDGEEIKK